MDHQPHVRLVDPHAERVGGDDDPQVAADEARLRGLFGFRRQPGMEVLRRQAFVPQECGDFFGRAAGGAIDDRAAGSVIRQVGCQHLVNMG